MSKNTPLSTNNPSEWPNDRKRRCYYCRLRCIRCEKQADGSLPCLLCQYKGISCFFDGNSRRNPNKPGIRNLKVSSLSLTSTETSLSTNMILKDKMRNVLKTGSSTLVIANYLSIKDTLDDLLEMNSVSPSEVLNSIIGTFFCYAGVLMEESDPDISNNRSYLLSRLTRQHNIASLKSSPMWNEASLDSIQALQSLLPILPAATIREVQGQILKLLAKMRASTTDSNMLKVLNSFCESFDETLAICDFVFLQSRPDSDLRSILLNDEDYLETLNFDNPAHKRACLFPLLLESSPPPKSLDEYHELVSRSDRSLMRILAIACHRHPHNYPLSKSIDFQITIINLIRLLDVQKRWREKLISVNNKPQETEGALFFLRLTKFGKEDEVVTLKECCNWFVFIFKTLNLIEIYPNRWERISHEIKARLRSLKTICSNLVDQEIERLSQLFKTGLQVADALPRMTAVFWFFWLTKTLQSLPGGLPYLDSYLSPARKSPVPFKRREQAVFWVVSAMAKLHLLKFLDLQDFQDFYESHRGILSRFRKDDEVLGTPNFQLGAPLRVSEDVLKDLDHLRRSLDHGSIGDIKATPCLNDVQD